MFEQLTATPEAIAITAATAFVIFSIVVLTIVRVRKAAKDVVKPLPAANTTPTGFDITNPVTGVVTHIEPKDGN